MTLEPMAIGVMLGVGDDPRASMQKVLDVGVTNAQMGRPADAWLAPDKAAELRGMIEDSGVTITTVFVGFAGESYADIPTVQRTVGLVPAETRAERLAKACEISDFAKIIGCGVVAAHIGFVPEDQADPQYAQILAAVQAFADHAAGNGQKLALETGQETGPCLRRFLGDLARPNVGVNFDPANMILYGSGDPIEALKLVGEHVIGVHCKDGTGPTQPGQLGHETPLGQGDVGIETFIRTLAELGYRGPLTIEREISGDQQKLDIIEARKLLEGIRDRILREG